MAPQIETPAQRNARYQREFRSRNGEVVQRHRVVKSITKGVLPRAATLEKHGITLAEFNRIRSENGLPAIDASKYPLSCRKPNCVQVPRGTDPAPSTPSSPSAEDVPLPSPEISVGITAKELVQKIRNVRGQPRLDKNDQLVYDEDGKLEILENSTVKQAADNLDRLFRRMGLTEGNVVRALRDTKKTLAFMRKEWKKFVTFKVYPGSIVTAAKYYSPFKRLLGEEAYEEYRQAMMKAMKISTDEAIARTESLSVTPIAEIRDAAKDVSKKYGDTSLRGLAAHMQSNQVGLRDNLSGVVVVSSAKEAIDNGHPNYYVPRTRVLHIGKFKTSKQYPAYRFVLSTELGKRIAKSLRE